MNNYAIGNLKKYKIFLSGWEIAKNGRIMYTRACSVKGNRMIVLGIDPGLATVGYGVVSCDEKTRLELIDYGTILTEAGTALRSALIAMKHAVSYTHLAGARRGPGGGFGKDGRALRVYAVADQAGGGRIRTRGQEPGTDDG